MVERIKMAASVGGGRMPRGLDPPESGFGAGLATGFRTEYGWSMRNAGRHPVMKRALLACVMAGSGVWAASAQQTIQTPVLMGVGADQLTDQRQDDRVGHRPLAREDKTLLVGRELRQGESVMPAAAPRKSVPDSPRVRARELLRDDRARVKREAALAD